MCDNHKYFMQAAIDEAEKNLLTNDGGPFGAVIVKDKRVLATGYNGAPSGVVSCKERGECLRKKLNIPSGTRHEVCYAVHAEQNAICQAAKMGFSVDGATIYVTHQPCTICTKMILENK